MFIRVSVSEEIRNHINDCLTLSLCNSMQGATFGDLVGGAKTYYSFELFLEIRGENEEFQVYRRGGLNLKILVIRLPSGEVDDPVHIRAEQTWKTHQLKDEIARVSV